MSHEHNWIPHYRTGATEPDSYVCTGCDAVREPTAFEQSQKKQTTSAGRWWGKSVIYGKEAEHATPYMTRYWIGRLRLHIFHRGDQDPDCHDHPWDFWTFPLTPYVEEVAERTEWLEYEVNGKKYSVLEGSAEAKYSILAQSATPIFHTFRQVVPAWRLTFRPATHTHRVLGRAVLIEHVDRNAALSPNEVYQDDAMRVYHRTDGPIITLVWRSRDKREWGFLKNRDGKWCWIAWKAYVFGGGKDAPCS